jgi:O-methyltransferase involved in polyketide biosynthesis
MNTKEFRDRAAFVAYLRGFAGIPYAEQIMREANLEKVIEENPTITSQEFLKEAPRFEARFMSVSRLIEMRGTNQILELAAGFSTRGLIVTADPSIHYIETDLEPTISEKRQIVSRIINSENILRSNLQFAEVNVLEISDLEKVANMLIGPVTIIHEGLFAYFNPTKVKKIADSICRILSSNGGVWITPDLTTKSKRKQISSKVTEIFSGNKEDSIANNAFENQDHIINLLSEVGLSVEVFLQQDLIDNLVSVTKLNLNQEAVDGALQGRKIYCITIK